jgi:signal transduction histidine kinase/ActR/RegA family two-component response regulator
MPVKTFEEENAELRRRLEEAEETLRAIHSGAVDALVFAEPAGNRVYTLEGADRPYRLLVEQMQQGAATLHADGTIAYCNLRLAELLAVPHEKLTGAALRDFVDGDRQVYDELLRQGRIDTGRGEAGLLRADGVALPVYLTFNLLPEDCGAAIGVLVTDLTSQKHHEKLAAAEEALRESDRRKNEFLAMLAHELRNPLAPMRNAVTILQQRTGADAATVHATSAMLARQVNQMVRLVDDLLDLSRISRNKVDLRKECVDLASIVDRAVESIGPICADMRHHLTVALPAAAVYLDGDPERLVQVFNNLLENACKYMEPGGRVSLVAEVSGGRDEVVVRVKDNGIGIARDQLDRIFDMFAQVDTSLTRSRSGLGIGLTLVKNIVEAHGGRVVARSEGENRGSEFEVTLPTLAASRPRPPEPALHPESIYRILVVDDNRDSAESLAMMLNLSGHETEISLDGEQALAAAAAFRPDVVLLDLGMPKVNGYEVCRRLREQPWGETMTVIAQTGWGQAEDKRRTQAVGFDAHLVKPVDPAALMKVLDLRRPRAAP